MAGVEGVREEKTVRWSGRAVPAAGARLPQWITRRAGCTSLAFVRIAQPCSMKQRHTHSPGHRPHPLLQVTSTVALKRVRVAPAAALNYLSVVWALLADYLVFGHAPAPLSLLGAGLICCSTFALLLWEARAKAAGGSGRPLKPSRSGAVEAGPDAAAEEQRLLQPQEPEGGPPGPGPEQELAELGWAAGGSAARRRHLLPQHGGVGQGREGSGELTESEEDGTAGRQHLQGPQRTQEKEGVVEAQVGGGGVTAEGERRPQIVRS